MQLITSISELRKSIGELKIEQKRINFVPTMGFLHAGHRQLIREARQSCDILVVSIFVNPLQFGINEDLASYPRDLASDSQLCQDNQVDILFTPQSEEILGTTPHLATVQVANLDQHLCGASRPGHFNGVCTIVSKLLNLVQPEKIFLGKKDIQQYRIIEQMVSDLNFPLQVIGVETVRAADGLALSSRNSYLSSAERSAATIVPELLDWVIREINNGGQRQDILARSLDKVSLNPHARLDYLEIVDYQTLQPTANFQQPLIIASAIYIGKTRLIDNRIVNLPAVADGENPSTQVINPQLIQG